MKSLREFCVVSCPTMHGSPEQRIASHLLIGNIDSIRWRIDNAGKHADRIVGSVARRALYPASIYQLYQLLQQTKNNTRYSDYRMQPWNPGLLLPRTLARPLRSPEMVRIYRRGPACKPAPMSRTHDTEWGSPRSMIRSSPRSAS